MTYILTHVLLVVTPIYYSLYYVASSLHTNKGKKTVSQYASVTLNEINIVVNAKFHELLRLLKIWTVKEARLAHACIIDGIFMGY